MPQDITTLIMPKIVIYSPKDYPEKEYKRLKILLDNGKREEVINELKILYPKDSYLANLLANRLDIDIQKELGILYHYQDLNYSTTAQITNENNLEITMQYDNFHDTLQTIKNATQYKGNLADTLMAMISGTFASMAELAKQLDSYVKDNVRKFGVKGQIAYWIFQAQGAFAIYTTKE